MLNFFNSMLVRLFSGSVLHEEDGQTFVEYALLIVFIALVAVLGATLLGTKISSLFSSIANNL